MTLLDPDIKYERIQEWEKLLKDISRHTATFATFHLKNHTLVLTKRAQGISVAGR